MQSHLHTRTHARQHIYARAHTRYHAHAFTAQASEARTSCTHEHPQNTRARLARKTCTHVVHADTCVREHCPVPLSLSFSPSPPPTSLRVYLPVPVCSVARTLSVVRIHTTLSLLTCARKCHTALCHDTLDAYPRPIRERNGVFTAVDRSGIRATGPGWWRGGRPQDARGCQQ